MLGGTVPAQGGTISPIATGAQMHSGTCAPAGGRCRACALLGKFKGIIVVVCNEIRGMIEIIGVKIEGMIEML